MNKLAETEDILTQLEDRISGNSDIAKAMENFFKDKLDTSGCQHDIDLRSRLTAKAVRGHSVINFLSGIKVTEADNCSLASGLDIFSISLKRHVLSLDGKSRTEIIELFKANIDATKPISSFNLMSPVGENKK